MYTAAYLLNKLRSEYNSELAGFRVTAKLWVVDKVVYGTAHGIWVLGQCRM